MKKLIFLLPLILLVACNPFEQEEAEDDTSRTNQGSTNPTPTPTPAPGRYGVIFPTATQVNGSGVNSGSGSGLTSMDAICASEATGHGLTGTFKALVGSGSGRRACSTADCSGGPAENSNWVVLGLTEFRRLDKTTVIGTTTSSGIFTFPLSQAFEATGKDIWTGLNANWTGSGASFNCNGWSIFNAGGTGNIADSGATTTDAIFTGNNTCDNTHPFLCVEQVDPPTQESYRRIFMTAGDYKGGSGFLNADGVRDFDAICASEAKSKGLIFSTYKAMIMTNDSGDSNTNQRWACYSANCSGADAAENNGWVLEANREYRREDGTTVIGTTTANGIFNFPLTNSFTGTADTYWTGFPNTWAILTTGFTTGCLEFESNSAGASSYFGVGNSTSNTSIDNGTGSCATDRKILCVEQTR